jgi:hypothetical protein
MNNQATKEPGKGPNWMDVDECGCICTNVDGQGRRGEFSSTYIHIHPRSSTFMHVHAHKKISEALNETRISRMNTDLQIGFQRRGAKVPRRRGNSFFATYASWRLCVKSERAVRDKPRYSALFRLIGGDAARASALFRDKPRYSALSRAIPR